MNEIANVFLQNEKFGDYLKEIKMKKGPISILGLVDVAKSVVVHSTNVDTKRPVCIITYN